MSGYTVKVRGAGARYVSRDYACPEHGTFDALVERNHAEERVPQPCPECSAPSEQVISAPPVHTQFVVSATRGPSSKPPPGAPDFRPLAEGQKLSEWRKERAKVHREDRLKRMKELL